MEGNPNPETGSQINIAAGNVHMGDINIYNIEIDQQDEEEQPDDDILKPQSTSEGAGHLIPGRSTSSGTGDTGSSSRKQRHVSTASSTDRSSFEFAQMSIDSNFWTCSKDKIDENPEQDDFTSGSSQRYIAAGRDVHLGEKRFIRVRQNIVYNIESNQKDEEEQREKSFTEKFQAKLFVETKGYQEAKAKLETQHVVLITGSTGEGKSFTAKKLVQEKIKQGYSFKEVDNLQQWQEHVHWRKRQVVFIDDIFGLVHSKERDEENQRLINQISLVKDEGLKSDLLFVVMTCRNSVIRRIRQYLKTSHLFQESTEVDLSLIDLSQQERLDIIEKHLEVYRKSESLDKSTRLSISKCKCPVGFPYCVYMFTRNDKLFHQGKQFFNSPTKYVRDEVHYLYSSDIDVYALLAFLLITGGEIKEETLHSLGEESVEFKLLKHIAHFPSAIQLGTRLQSALKRVDDAFVMKNGANIQFRHSCVSEAMCFSFSKILTHVAIQWLPLEFILDYIRTADFEKTDDDEIVLINNGVYPDLARRFINEIEKGNIFEVIRHQALSDPKFVLKFVDILESLKKDNIERLCFILQVTEQSSQLSALLNGSLLYWTSSLNLKNLCSLLLERRFYDIIKDKFWVKIQASAALVPACWYGFEPTILKDLLRIGADINSSIHDDRSWQTRECDYCTVHDIDGMTTIQASVFGVNIQKDETINFLLSNGACFNELSKHRPLIGAIKLFNSCDKENIQPCVDIARKTIHILLGGGVNVNWKDQNGRTALWYVVYYDNVDVAELLVETCRDIMPQPLLAYARSIEMVNILVDHNIDTDFSQTDNDGKTLLHRAQHESLVLHFLNNGCHIGQRDRDGRTPIFYSKNLAICKKLIENGSAINTEDFEGKNVFHFIKNLEILEYISSAFPREVVSRCINKEDRCNRTPIFTSPSLEVFKLFTTFDADVNHRAQQYSFSENETTLRPVGECIFSKSDESSAKQRKRPTDLYSANYIMCLPDNFSEVPSDFYDLEGRATNVPNSINTSGTSSSSNVSSNETNRSNSSGDKTEWEDEETSTERCTVAMKFAKTGKLTLDITRELKSRGADFALMDEDNNTILHCVLTPTGRMDHIDQILLTVLDNAEPWWKRNFVNFQNSNGDTALHLACSCSDMTKLIHPRTVIIKILLDAGTDVELHNNNNETALHCLLKCTCLEKYEICQLFKKLVPDLNIYSENKWGEVPIKQLCSLPGQSKRFIIDAQKTIELLYKSSSFKTFFIKNIHFFVTQCNICLLETLFNMCIDLSKEDIFEIYCCCKENRLCVSSWVILSMLDDVSLNEIRIELEVNERHALLRDCIEQINSGSSRDAVLKVLFRQVEDVNATDDDGRSFLINAIKASSFRKNHLYKLVSYFLDLGVDPNIKDVNDMTAFHHCILSPGRDDRVKKCALLLSERGGNLNVGKPLLMMTDVNRLRVKCIKFLPKSILPNQKDEKGNAFHHLMIAYSKYGLRIHVSTTSMSALFGRGVDINMYNNDGETPLHVAIRLHVQCHVIMEMLRNGADVNKEKRSHGESSGVPRHDETNDITDDEINVNEGRSPFQYMFIYQHNINMRLVKEMLKYGADPFHKDKHGQNAFHHLTTTVKPNCLKVILLLLHHFENSYQDLNIGDLYGNTLLHKACVFNHGDTVWCTSIRVAIVRQLLAKGMSANEINNDGNTPFHLLVVQYFDFAKDSKCKYIHNIFALISVFLSYGVDVKIRNSDGKTVLDLITESGNKELANVIENRICPSEYINISKH